MGWDIPYEPIEPNVPESPEPGEPEPGEPEPGEPESPEVPDEHDQAKSLDDRVRPGEVARLLILGRNGAE
jgi:hypothetical protein